MERLAQRYPEEYQLPMPDPPHNIKSVRSSLFWYWLFLDDYLINIRMLLIIRRDQDDNIARSMTVTMKALKNKDRMSVETALEVMLPSVQSAIPDELIVATIVPEIYTFWRQNRPGAATCLIDVTVYEPFSMLFFTDAATNQIVMCSLHCPATLAVVAGENDVTGFCDGKKSLFKTPTGLCLHGHLLFSCDSGNSALRIVDASHLLSRKKNNVQLDETISETGDEDHADDSIPIPSKCTVTAKINLASTGLQLQQPFSVCLGRQLMQDYPDLYVGDIGAKIIFKITDLTVSSRATKARFQQFYPSTKSSSTILPMGLHT